MERATHLSERMDDPACDPDRLDRTYAQFSVVNQLVSGWRSAWRQVVAPAVRRAIDERGEATVLDVGSGGGDLARQLALWTREEQLPVRIVGIDPDARALRYARARQAPPNVRFLPHDLTELAHDGRRYDVVVSNHVLHHLPEPALKTFLSASRTVARHAVLHSDLRRTRLSLPAFAVISLPFRRSFVREDGFISIRRAWRPEELARIVPGGLEARRDGISRLWVVGGRRP